MKKSNPPADREEIVRLHNVAKSYVLGGERTTVLQPTTLFVCKGEYVSIIGPSGSGKSTLMHLIGLLDTPSEGEVFLDGENVSSLSETKLAKVRNEHIGFVFQQFNLLPKTAAWEQVALPLLYKGIASKERYTRAVLMLGKVGLSDKIRNRPNQLSGGQQQRVALARALINDPDIILADEPTGNLDHATGIAIMEMFDQFNKEGKTIVLVTHEAEVARHARRHLRIIDGVMKEVTTI